MRIRSLVPPLVLIGALAVLSIPCLAIGSGLFVGPFDSTPDRWKNGVRVIVFLNPGANEAQTQALASKLETDPEVERFTFVTKEEAYVEFETEFEDSDQIRSSVEVADMPPSFRIVPRDSDVDSVRALADSFRNDAGVFQAVTGPVLTDFAGRGASVTIGGASSTTKSVFLGIGVALLFTALLTAVVTIVVLHDGAKSSVAQREF